MSLSRETVMSHIRWQLDAMRVSLAFIRVDLALRGYNPNQPRVPAGSSEGGRWTDGGGGGAGALPSDLPTRYVQLDAGLPPAIDLRNEEIRGGHALSRHVGKTDEEMLERVRASRRVFLTGIYGRRRVGSFKSVEAANELVNRTIQMNAIEVDLVSSGKKQDAFLTSDLAYNTGREAYTDGYLEPYMRATTGVGVYILHDPRSRNGFRVRTAYPRNDGD